MAVSALSIAFLLLLPIEPFNNGLFSGLLHGHSGGIIDDVVLECPVNFWFYKKRFRAGYFNWRDSLCLRCHNRLTLIMLARINLRK